MSLSASYRNKAGTLTASRSFNQVVQNAALLHGKYDYPFIEKHLALHVTDAILLHVTSWRMIMGTNVVQRVQKYRQALRAAGLRPVQIWVPDTKRSGFAEECRRQSLSLRGDAHEATTLNWLESVADNAGWE